jgi:hypothetical protein
VQPGMRVGAVPAVSNDRDRLDVILRPHGIVVRVGPGATLIVVRAARDPKPPSRPAAAEGIIRGVVVDARTAAPLGSPWSCAWST